MKKFEYTFDYKISAFVCFIVLVVIVALQCRLIVEGNSMKDREPIPPAFPWIYNQKEEDVVPLELAYYIPAACLVVFDAVSLGFFISFIGKSRKYRKGSTAIEISDLFLYIYYNKERIKIDFEDIDAAYCILNESMEKEENSNNGDLYIYTNTDRYIIPKIDARSAYDFIEEHLE